MCCWCSHMCSYIDESHGLLSRHGSFDSQDLHRNSVGFRSYGNFSYQLFDSQKHIPQELILQACSANPMGKNIRSYLMENSFGTIKVNFSSHRIQLGMTSSILCFSYPMNQRSPKVVHNNTPTTSGLAVILLASQNPG